MQEGTTFISNERYTHSLVNVRMHSNWQKNVGWPRKRWTDQHRRRWNRPGMAYTLREMLMKIMMISFMKTAWRHATRYNY